MWTVRAGRGSENVDDFPGGSFVAFGGYRLGLAVAPRPNADTSSHGQAASCAEIPA